MTRISREELLKLAQAARLHLTEEEMPALVERLESVLGYASYLKEVAAQHEGAPLPKMSNVTREDKAVPTAVEPLLELAPNRDGNYIVVPAILKQ